MKLSQQIREMDVKSKVMAGLALVALLGAVAFAFVFWGNVLWPWMWTSICVLSVLLVAYAISWCRSVPKNQMAALAYGVTAFFCLHRVYIVWSWFYGVRRDEIIEMVLLAVAALLLVGAAVQAMRNKSFVLVVLGACIAKVGAYVCDIWDWYDYIIALQIVAFCGALFMLSITPNRCVSSADVPSVEQKLNLLKEKHDLGILTDEQYQAQRQEVLMNM